MRRKLSGQAFGLLTANVLAASALFAATGGTTWAARLIGTNQIVDQAITTPKLAEGAVSGTKIRTAAVTSSRIAPGAVTPSRIAAGAVTGVKIARGTITGSKIARDAITKAKIATNSVGTSEIANGSISADDLGSKAVNGRKIVDRSITSLDLADKSIGRRHFSRNALRMIWPNAAKLGGLKPTDVVTRSQNAAVFGERRSDIPVPTTESSIARIDSRDLKGLSLILVRLTITNDSTTDMRGFVQCRAVYGTRSSAWGVAGFQRYAANGGIVIGGNTIVLTDFHQFALSGRNTIDVRCKSTSDHTLAQDISITSVRMGSVANATVA